MMVSVFSNREDCCGCSACQKICPQNAIAMSPDEEGFLYPEIDQSHCVDCGKCTKICPVIRKGHYVIKNSEVYNAEELIQVEAFC